MWMFDPTRVATVLGLRGPLGRVAINGNLGGEGPPPDLEIKVGRFQKKLAGLLKKLAGLP